MLRTGIKTRVPISNSRKLAAARQAVKRASAVLRARSTVVTGSYAPLATRGFWGQYSKRGRAELKVIDSSGTNLVAPIPGTVILLNGVAIGSDFNTRIGRRITMKSILMNINYFPTGGANLNASIGTYSRFSVVYDSQPNSQIAVPAYTDIFVNSTPNAPINLNNRDRFYVLMEMRGQVGSYTMSASNNLATGSPQNKFWSKFRRMTKETIFSGTNDTIANIATGALYLCVVSDVTLTCSFDYFSRVRFEDI